MNKDIRRVSFAITEENYEYIKQVMKKYGLKQSPALVKIIEEHEGTYVESEVEDIKKRVIRNNSVINSVDQKVDMLLNILNAIALNENHNIYTSPDKVKSPLYEKAEAEVKSKKEKEMVRKRKQEGYRW